MRDRCNNPNHHKYYRYGARGIKVCERWDLFKNFVEDMGARPEGHTIDRINNDGDYTPENCRWATKKEQQRNTSRNKNITIDGVTQCKAAWVEELGSEGALREKLGIDRKVKKLEWRGQKLSVADWAKETGLDPVLLRSRLGNGWSVDKALSTPVTQHQGITHEGTTQTVNAWATQYGIDPRTLRSRLERGWPMDKALKYRANEAPVKKNLLTWRGETLSVKEWAGKVGITTTSLHARLKNGWSLDDALTLPKGVHRSNPEKEARRAAKLEARRKRQERKLARMEVMGKRFLRKMARACWCRGCYLYFTKKL